MDGNEGRYGFGAAGPGEQIVFGAQRPGFNGTRVTAAEVDEWIGFMRGQGVRRVVCLLPDEQLAYYSSVPGGLLERYATSFGKANVAHRPIPDFRLSDQQTLRAILGDLKRANSEREKVVIHCSGGIGRTGHVLAAWLVHGRGYAAKEAIAAVRQMGRNPREAVDAGLVAEDELMALLDPSLVNATQEQVQNPPKGLPRILAHLCYDDVGAAVEWLTAAFGFRERTQYRHVDGGRVTRTQLDIVDSVITVGEPSVHAQSPRQGVSSTLYVYVDNVDDLYRRALEAGAKIVQTLENRAWGDRSFQATDPQGHQWVLAQHIEDVEVDEHHLAEPATRTS